MQKETLINYQIFVQIILRIRFLLFSSFRTLIFKDLESKFSRPVTQSEKVITNFTFPYSAMQRKLVEERGGSRNIYNIA